MDIKTLKILSENKHSVGSKNLSEILQVNPNYFTDTIEPTLVIQGYIQRSPRGRQITNRGKSIINKT